MDAAGEGQGKETLGTSDQQRNGLAGVAIDEFRFGVVSGFLVKLLNRRHFAIGFRRIDSIADEDRAVINFGYERGRQTRQDKATPKGGEEGNGNGLAVKKIEKPVIENLLQA